MLPNREEAASRFSKLREDHPRLIVGIVVIIVLIIVFRMFIGPVIKAYTANKQADKPINATAVQATNETPNSNSPSTEELDRMHEDLGITKPEQTEAAQQQAPTANLVGLGQYGDLTWSLDSEGTLVLRPTNGVSGTLNPMGSYDEVPWQKEYKNQIKTLVIDPGVVAGPSLSGMFSGHGFEAAYVSNLDMMLCEDASAMFANCGNLKAIDAASWNTSHLKTTQEMFAYCASLESLDASRWDMGQVENMNSMFMECSALQSCGCEKWKTPNLNSGDLMFKNCPAIPDDLSTWGFRPDVDFKSFW